ncbi:hypothetical protein ECP03022939_4045 [Escherichia coli P0302293.9]|nr:hypothetical protein [Klebsiella pneumoniae]EMX09823.1 hypothetical protein ECP03022932_4922 [Escherichia coli P0302293.2]ENA14594.1 hypothetical protein EC2016001_5078 [Escherichia coli 201600.1]ENB93716.1 hypothetical protein ECP02994384_5292 [Escherichia coli P0299438.4]END90058.1 hypothetical protein ECP03022937_5153 [Escherichia coli P0302293.7]ENE18383.1 hypothetical protein ECP03022933_5011 [Escherichia coli P0302293.3]ENE32867.1 hypothetical protein ECP03022936_4787 [Escherichia co
MNGTAETARTVFAVWIKQVLPGLLFSYLRLTFSGVFLLLFLRSHYLPAG